MHVVMHVVMEKYLLISEEIGNIIIKIYERNNKQKTRLLQCWPFYFILPFYVYIYMYIKTIVCFIVSEKWICYIVFLKYASAFGK